MSSLYVVVNPIARRYSERRLRNAIRFFEKEFSEVNLLYTENRGDAERICRDLASKGEKLVVVVGGDGTLNEAINGVAKTETSIGFIPAGTTNVAAKELNIIEDYEGATLQILKGKIRELNLGVINNRYFLLMAGAGFDGETVHNLNKTLKRISGKGAYILSGTKLLIRGNLEKFSVKTDRDEYECYTAIVCNSACYGGTFKVCPDASPFSDTLYLCIMQNGSRRDILRYVGGILTGRHLRYRDLIYTSSDTVLIKGSPHIQIDGDYFGKGPAEVRLERKALRMVY